MAIDTSSKKYLLFFLSRNHGLSLTALMKLVYLVDLKAVKVIGKQLSEYQYRRYLFGPFDPQIYSDIDNLLTEGTIESETRMSQSGDEYLVFTADAAIFDAHVELEEQELQILESILDATKGLGAGPLTKAAYSTKPMLALGATMGGNQMLNHKLDLTAE